MDVRGWTTRLAVGITIAGLAGSGSGPVVAASPGATSPAPTIEITDVSIRPFGIGYVTVAYLAVDEDGGVYLPGGTDGAALFKLAPDGTIAARWPGLEIVPGQPDTIAGIAIDPGTGEVWASDMTADRIVHLDADLALVDSFGTTGPGPGQLNGPGGLDIAPDGTIVVADTGGDRIERFSADGTALATIDAPGGAAVPVDVAVAPDGSLLTATAPGFSGRVVHLAADGSSGQELAPAGTTDLLFPDVATTAAGEVLVADAWNGVYTQDPSGARIRGPITVPGMGTSPFAVREAPSGDLYSLACQFESTDCTLARLTPEGEVLAQWHAAAAPTLLGSRLDANGHQLYLQCVGKGSPTIVWSSGSGGSGWVGTQQYLMGQLAADTRFCTLDRLETGLSERTGEEDFAHWWADVDDLHAALTAAGETGPYVMAGYSYGGLLARLFTDAHPDEVVGLLAIDPAHEDQFAGPVDPMAPLGITSCADASCPVFEDIAKAHEMTGGTVAGSLGDLPLIVLTRNAAQPFGPSPEYEAWWLKMGVDTATASSNSRHITSAWSGHPIPYAHPALVVEALQELVTAARATDHALPACEAAFPALGGICD